MTSMYIFINWQIRCSVWCTELVTKWIHERKTLYEILFWNTIFKKETITSSLIWKPYISHVRQIEIVLVWNQRRDVRRGGGSCKWVSNKIGFFLINLTEDDQRLLGLIWIDYMWKLDRTINIPAICPLVKTSSIVYQNM